MSTTKGNRFVQPYLFFNGNCEEAVEFYRKALGAEVEMTMRYNESPEPHRPAWYRPAPRTRSCTRASASARPRVMASDDCASEKADFQGFSLSLAVPSEG